MVNFKTYLLDELTDLHTSMENLTRQIAPLQRELEKLQAKYAALNMYLEADEDAVDTQALLVEHAVDRRNAADLMENVLRKAGRPLHYKEILMRLKTEENYDMPGKDPSANITARLSMNSQFVRVDKGTYTLRDLSLGQIRQKAEVRQDAESPPEHKDSEPLMGEYAENYVKEEAQVT